jgi:RNA polymerase sigma-70 factor (family 1)
MLDLGSAGKPMYTMKKLTEQIIRDFQQGDKKAFVLVFKAYYVIIVLFAKKITGNLAEAEDIVTEVFIALSKRVKLFETEINIRSFLYISARNACLNYLKKEKRVNDLRKEFVRYIQDDKLLEYEYSIKADLVESVHNAIEGLPEECRKVFKMLYYEELKPAEIAERLRLSVNTVYAQKRRAMQALRLSLNNNKNT